jgi:hypothetical protein
MDNLDMLQRQDTGTGFRGRSKGQVTDEVHMDNWTCYRGRTHGQDTEADLDRLQKKVIWTTGRAIEAGHRDRIYSTEAKDREISRRLDTKSEAISIKHSTIPHLE